MNHIKKFQDFVNEAKNAGSAVQLNKQGKEEIKKLEQAMSSLQDALNNANWKELYKQADKVKYHANNLKNFNYVDESNQSEPVNESIVSGITVYEIASPAPVSMKKFKDFVNEGKLTEANYGVTLQKEAHKAAKDFVSSLAKEYNMSAADIKTLSIDLDKVLSAYERAASYRDPSASGSGW